MMLHLGCLTSSHAHQGHPQDHLASRLHHQTWLCCLGTRVMQLHLSLSCIRLWHLQCPQAGRIGAVAVSKNATVHQSSV